MTAFGLPEKLWILKANSNTCKLLSDAAEICFDFRLTTADEGLITQVVHADYLYNKHAVIVGRNPVPRRVIITGFSYLGNYTRINFDDVSTS